jgi:hypothetical protein
MPDSPSRSAPDRTSLTTKTIPYLRRHRGQLVVIAEMAADLGIPQTTLYGQLRKLRGPMDLDRSIAACVRVPHRLPELDGEPITDPAPSRQPSGAPSLPDVAAAIFEGRPPLHAPEGDDRLQAMAAPFCTHGADCKVHPFAQGLHDFSEPRFDPARAVPPDAPLPHGRRHAPLHVPAVPLPLRQGEVLSLRVVRVAAGVALCRSMDERQPGIYLVEHLEGL